MSKILVIAGMHRSGTSLTAGWLHKCGLSMGEKLMTGGFGNPKGHFEDWEIVNIHEDRLKRMGFHTTGLRLKKNAKFELDNIAIEKITSLKEKRENLSQWAWKEPRGTLFLESWKKNTPNLKCVAIYRDYNNVIDSLKRRTYHSVFKTKKYKTISRIKMKATYPLYIKNEIKNYTNSWITYNQAIVKFKENYQDECLIFDINDIIEKNNEVYKAIEEKFGFEMTYFDINNFFEEKLMKKNTANFKFSKKNEKQLSSTLSSLKKYNYFNN